MKGMEKILLGGRSQRF